MEDTYIVEDLRRRLILAGFSELVDRGVGDFSLRRVAIAAEVSCAAPYRHFKDKDELILAVVRYAYNSWSLLAIEIQNNCSQSAAESVAAICELYVRFWLGNGNFRSVLLMMNDGAHAELAESLRDFDAPIRRITRYFASNYKLTAEDEDVLVETILSHTWGAIMRISSGLVDREKSIRNLKNKIFSELLVFY